VYFIDATEGVSADMLLAALLGQLSEDRRQQAIDSLKTAASALGIKFEVNHVKDSGEGGLIVSYEDAGSGVRGTTHEEALRVIEEVCSSLGLEAAVSRSIVEKIFDAESQVHGIPKEQVHLHEIGRPEALFNMAAIGYLSQSVIGFRPEDSAFTTVTTGKGSIRTAHGELEIPAPATARLLTGFEHTPGDCPGERATPTGVAALTTIASMQVTEMPEGIRSRSVGFGTRRYGGRLGRMAIAVRDRDRDETGETVPEGAKTSLSVERIISNSVIRSNCRLSSSSTERYMPDRGEGFPRPTKTLDCIGLYCPEPVFRTREEISTVQVGQILEVLADDPASESDIESWAKHAGQELISVERTEGGFRFLIRRKS